MPTSRVPVTMVRSHSSKLNSGRQYTSYHSYETRSRVKGPSQLRTAEVQLSGGKTDNTVMHPLEPICITRPIARLPSAGESRPLRDHSWYATEPQFAKISNT